MRDRVADAIASQVLSRTPVGQAATAASVAEEIGVSMRTLQRKLSAEGASFRDVSAAVRRSLAEQMIVSGQDPYAVSDALGFSRPSAFYRAFRRWTGMATRDFRRALRPARPATLPLPGIGAPPPPPPESGARAIEIEIAIEPGTPGEKVA